MGLPPLKLEGKISSSSVTAGHLEVDTVEFDFKVDDDISIGHIDPLIWQRAGNVPLTPSNHSDLMTLIDLVVNDGIRAAGLKNKLEFKSDYAIPSLRPDGVLTRDSVPVGVLELKFPRDSEKNFKKHCGQAYDYLRSEKENRHVVSPIGLLTYYTTWFVCELPEEERDEKKTHSPQRTETPLPTPSTPSTTSPPSETGPSSSKSGSPGPRTSIEYYSMEKKRDKKEKEERKDDNKDKKDRKKKANRILRISRFESSDGKFWPMIVTVLRRMCATTFFIPSPESPRFVKRVSESHFLDWKLQEKGLTELKLSSFPEDCESFYLWEELGHGANGRAFLASSEKGDACVVKFFFSSEETLSEKEFENWEKVYGTTYPVRQTNLLNRKCLLMKFFSFIDPADRRSCVCKVEKCLRDYFVKNKMKHNDVWWRNIGLDNDGNVVVYDLGNLEQCDDDSWVHEAIEGLEGRIGGKEEDSSLKRRLQPHRAAKKGNEWESQS